MTFTVATISRLWPFLVFFAVVIIPPSASLAAKTCTTLADLGKFKNKFVCPLQGGGIVRAGDACAQEGGTFDAARKGGKRHHALDLNSKVGATVVAIKPGRVAVASKDWGGMGQAVIIDHEDGDYTIYGHLSSVSVTSEQCVAAGAVIGAVGYSGNAACLQEKKLVPHLHVAFIRAAQAGLADQDKPIATASRNAEDWLELAKDFFPNDNLDLGIRDPQVLLSGIGGCIKSQ